jgi:pseudouridine-5'-phosphate glycosidase
LPVFSIRDAGAVPAAIAVVDGALRVGLDEALLERFARGADIMKLSRADVAWGLVSVRLGALTVAATMIAAKLAGTRIFATAGIGGVHRGAETNFDISADLNELARIDVCVVGAGAKALLDLPKTLEMLESLGVPVICYRSDVFPAFWSRSNGLPAPTRIVTRIDSADDVAAFLTARDRLGLDGGVLVANPVPADAEIPLAEMSTHIDGTAKSGIAGKTVTPFLLEAINRLTSGRSLRTNVALVKNNARLAAEIAIARAAPDLTDQSTE